MNVSKGLGSNSRVQYQKIVWLTCQKIRLTFDFIIIIIIIMVFLVLKKNLLPFCALGRVKNASLLATTLWESKKPVMSTLELIKKWGSLCSLNNVLNPWLFHSHKFWATKGKKKQWKITKNEKMSNLRPSIILWFSKSWALV